MRTLLALTCTYVAATPMIDKGAPVARPVTLLITQDGSATNFQVAAMAEAPTVLDYRLEITSPSPVRNVVSQHGRATLSAGKRQILVATILSGSASRHWTATLTVNPIGGESYIITRHPDE